LELRLTPPVKGCLALASGDSRADEGVAEFVFLGIKLGDGCANLGNSGNFDAAELLALVIVLGLFAVAAA
jgi:hypothetical protein